MLCSIRVENNLTVLSFLSVAASQTLQLHSWVCHVNVYSVWHVWRIRCEVMVETGERQRARDCNKMRRDLVGFKWGACLTLVLSLHIKWTQQPGEATVLSEQLTLSESEVEERADKETPLWCSLYHPIWKGLGALFINALIPQRAVCQENYQMLQFDRSRTDRFLSLYSIY